MTSPIILALDTKDLETARGWIAATNKSVSTYKIGLEFFLKFGEAGISSLREAGDFALFLDLKLHDIPNTVGAAVGSVAHIAPRFLTVHASGGGEMVAAAAKSAPDVSITAVTILTSLSEEDLFEIGYSHNALESAVALAKLATSHGARSVVCSPFEVAAIRNIVADDIELITPGVRPAGADLGDQKRVMTPADAIAAGANFLVIGRPISEHWKTSPQAMADAAAKIVDSL